MTTLIASVSIVEGVPAAIEGGEPALSSLAEEAYEARDFCLRATRGEDDGGWGRIGDALSALADMAWDLAP